MLTKWLNIALDLIYPPKCPNCRLTVERSGKWCEECFEAIFKDKPKKISPAQHGINHLQECLVVCSYTGIVRNLILDMKFKQNKRRGVCLAYILEKQIASLYNSKVDVVVPVPLHAQKLKERGFNQTEAIFRPWAKAEGLHWAEALERTRYTKPQWRLSAEERLENIKGAFALSRLLKKREDILEGKSVLLVDDILTTGQTMNECVEILNQAGSRQITGLILAGGDW